jgi:UDP-N-acetylmuramyl tripeptide synthase
VLGGYPPPAWVEALAEAIEASREPALLALVHAAERRGLPVLIDDGDLTIGAGKRLLRLSRQVPLPAVAEVDWEALGSVPTALITGTNGKTTTTRLVARMARAAGRVPGNTSSDGVAINEHYVTRGDWSGPDAARLVLRHPDVDMALLETARGGILRRGLALHHADVALITNVSADHLGSYGIDDVAGMAQVKAVVADVARVVVLNAGDPELRALGDRLGERSPGQDTVVWFGGAAGWRVVEGMITAPDGHLVMAVADCPITFAGKAAYNVENVLAACALATALGLPEEAIVSTLRGFAAGGVADNPGRGNLTAVGGVRVMVDFAHNPAAVRGVLGLCRALVGEHGHLWASIGMPGDRPDSEIAEVAAAIAAAAPSRVFVRELPEHLRGRPPGAVSALLEHTLARSGIAVSHAKGELAAVEDALAMARAGDLVVIFTHLDPAVDAMLAEQGHPTGG